MRAAGADADIESVNVVAEMCLTMLDDIAIELSKMEKEWREEKEGQKDEKQKKKI